MRFSSLFSRLVLLLMIPSLVVYPQCEILGIAVEIPKVTSQPASFPYHNQFSYDDILELLDEIEDDDFEKEYSPQEIAHINQFLAALAKQGVLPNDPIEEAILDADINELLDESQNNPNVSTYGTSKNNSFIYQLAAHSGSNKSWVSRGWCKTKKFVKNHKKEILIGGIVVGTIVIGVTVYVLLAPATPAITAGVASAAGATASSLDHHGDQSTPIIVETTNSHAAQVEISVATILEDNPALKTVVDKQVISLKEKLVEELDSSTHLGPGNTPKSIREKISSRASHIAHQTLEEIIGIVSVVPQFLEETKSVTEKIAGASNIHSTDTLLNNGTPIENYENAVSYGHTQIDNFFSTNLAENFTAENREAKAANQPVIGVVPHPSMLGYKPGGASSKRLVRTQVSDVCGWSVGQPINNKTYWGSTPKWSTVRSRYWKNQAHLAPQKFSGENLKRAQKGLAPQRINSNGNMESMELHHIPPQKDGGLFDFIELWPDEHASVDIHRHIRK